MSLEARLMFDAAAVTEALTQNSDHGIVEKAAQVALEKAPANIAKSAITQQMISNNPAEPSATLRQFDLVVPAKDGNDIVRGLRVITNGDPRLDNGKREIAFIDSSLDNWTQIAQGIRPGVEVVLLNSTSDGLTQVANYLAGQSNVDAIHILTHGETGEVNMGALRLTSSNISAHQADLTRIGAAMTANGDVLLYGCDIAKGNDGLNLIAQIAKATNTDVAASSDRTGASSLGGNWILENIRGILKQELWTCLMWRALHLF